jgi:L-ascorbate metabolism protein UlaG (beta-lactamase superfamily)
MQFIPKTRRGRVLVAALVAIAAALVVIAASTGWLDALGAKPSGERLARIQRSPNYRDGAFQNPGATNIGEPGSTWKMLRQWLLGHEQRVPPAPMPIVNLSRADFERPPASGLRATWLGHSTVLVEIDGARVLFDPVWARRASPSAIIGPVRFHAPPLALEQLPQLDAIVASHDHYDHLDRGVVKALLLLPTQANARFIVPLGVGAHLERWGVPANRITELDWSESTKAGAITITATPARHFSGRGITDGNHTLWASWAVAGASHRVFHSGDTGPFAGFATVGAEHGPFDLTFIKIGAYGETWPDIHLTPEQAVVVNTQVRGKVLLPIHWGTFNMAFHAWNEPAERVVAAAMAGTRLIVPRPGESVEPATARPVEPWWRAVR